MSLRFLIDQCVPEEIPARLAGWGHQVIRLCEALPIRSIDPVALTKAGQLDAILLSLNGDFSDIVACPLGSHGGIIAIPLHNHPEVIPALMNMPRSYLAAQPERAHYQGRLFTVEAHRIRIRG